ncbi:hypothetical protein, partial [Actinacidiphila oryziradicis]|uniref:hypothetical protein n=1 Tax=Actinacidiphila oryziradicis TaxID=2571141 RepID=UPI001B80DD8B
MSITCQAQSRPEAGAAHSGSLTRSRAVLPSTRSKVTCWRSIAASTTCAATAGGPSSSHKPAGNRPLSRRYAHTCRVRLRISAPLTPAGSAARNARHSPSERRCGSPGHVVRIAATRVRRCRASRRVRAAYSWAARRTRSETYTPSAGAAAPCQSRRRSAIHPLDGNSSPAQSTPAASTSSEASSHREAIRARVKSWHSPARKDTRSDST